MNRIEGYARTVRELLDNAHYTIDFYQREYAWQQRHVVELIDDLTSRFLGEYKPVHARPEVANYGPYFLGSVIISRKHNLKYIVDGQQRLTTLTLLLIHLRRLAQPGSGVRDVRNLIYSEQFGTKKLNIDVEDRREAIQGLLDEAPHQPDRLSESARNLLNRFEDIALPQDVTGEALPYFVDWLLEKVYLVEILAESDDDAYTIFETMNDRGLSLSLPDMLKGYVLANIRVEEAQRLVNATWKRQIQALRAHEGAHGDSQSCGITRFLSLGRSAKSPAA